jgi:PadR family transcriptional regulator PadR
MAGRNYFINGITELLILSMIQNKDCYVYEITKGIQSMSEELLSISQNTIYTAAYKMENEGYITEYSKLVGRKRTRVYYHLEEKGRVYLKELQENFRNTMDGVHKVLSYLAEEHELV